MESDTSLIEVAIEDDFLLQPIPEDDLLNLEKEADGITAGKSDLFLCSPLLIGRSNGTMAGSSTDYTDKENINANSIEGPKLSLVPQQMKRKKKAGGYNLRKSLAWNKAFFTEEGVLDSMELSMITGSTSTSCGEALGAIDEETPAMAGDGCYNDFSVQDKLFKDTSTSTPIGDRKNGRCLLPKRGSSTKDNVKLKELSAKDVNRSGSKRGTCPRTVASSSAKGPVTSNATKMVNKEERVSRIPVPKRDSTVISRTLRSAAPIRASDAKSNQVAQRAGNNPRMSTLKGSSSISAKSALNKDVNASKSSKAKTSIQQPRRKLANPVLKKNSSHSQHDSTDSKEGSKAATNSVISKPLPLNDDGTRKVSVSITQNTPPDGRSMLNQTQMPKPSGLRMPSPSMGFFGQKKVPSFQSLPLATSESRDLPKSNIPNVRTAGPSNPICQLATFAPRNFVKASNNEASVETKVVSCLSLSSSVEPVSHDRAKSALKITNIHLGKLNVVGASTTNKVLSAHGLEEPDSRSLSNPVLEHLADVSRIHDEINDQLAECKPHDLSFNNFGDSTKSYLGEANDLGSQGMPKAFHYQSNGAQDCNEQSSEQVEHTRSSSCMIKRTSPDHLGIETCNSLKRSRTSIEFEHGRFEENVGNDSNSKESCSFDQDEALESHKMRILRTQKAETFDIDHDISNESNTMQSTAALSNSDSMHIDDEKPTVPMSNSKSFQGNGCSLTFQHDYTSGENEVLARESNEACKNKLESEIDISLLPHSTADACLDSGPIDMNCNYHTDETVDIRSDIEQINTCLERERNQDGHDDVAISSNAAETLLINQDLCSSDIENQQYGAEIRIESEHLQNEEQNSHVLSSVNDFNQLPGHAELQNCCMDLVPVSQNHQGKCLNGDLLQTSNSEYKDEIITGSVINTSDVCISDCLNNYNQMASPKYDHSLQEEKHDTKTGDNTLESQEDSSLRSSGCSTAKSSECDKMPGGEGTSETMSKEITSEVRMTCNDSSFCSPPKGLGSLAHNDDILSGENVHKYMERELESPEMNGNILCQNENELNSETNDHLLDTETCSTFDDNAQSEARMTCNDLSFCSPTKDLGSSVPNDHILSKDMESKELENHKSPDMNGNVPSQNENEFNSEMDHVLDMETCSTDEDTPQSMLQRTSEDVGKQNALVIKTETNAVPFSEEWLAAIEAAGEEILTMKTGAVQNSPPDKSQPEPGPWSPVKRKTNQGIGPFDCTKCTTNNTSQLNESC